MLHVLTDRPRRCSVVILSRRVSEELWIGQSIRVKVVAIRGRQAVLAIDCPLGIAVERAEVRQRVLREGRRSYLVCGTRRNASGRTSEIPALPRECQRGEARSAVG
ncbi:MAG TPA: carbon storage regulator [Phycisphaerae bacterium]|nr:carbon storage regulator [Phycisphaerae bacterium]